MEEKTDKSEASYLVWLSPVLFIGSVLMLSLYRFRLADSFWPQPRMVNFFLIGAALSALIILGANLPPSSKRWGYLLLGVVLGCWLKP